ncbi:MAG: 4Fe-4S binding protein [Proteobacteria bacterium]|nr:4Fe-4S binding protein [Pseudomonadota bacterium]MBU1711181.1 4Fe-4S binding protein [Pseudomonadota bacterium]
MKINREIIEIDQELCNGCGQCVPDCAEGALQIIDGKAKLIAEKYCDGLGACLKGCPTGALKVVVRVADDFDEAAVEELLKQQKAAEKPLTPAPSGCPSMKLQSFGAVTPCQAANKPISLTGAGSPLQEATSALAHWPVKIRLVPPTAPFLKNADLLIAADCMPQAYANFHRDFLAGRALMSGCPKFDEVESYIAKFTEVFNTADIKSVTVAIMEVPCCAGMKKIVGEALKRSGKNIKTEVAVVSTRGEIIRREPLVV